MPPYIYGTDENGIAKPFQYLHPGIKKSTYIEGNNQPHVFQQSVTLTASMWKESDATRNMDWSFDNWRVLGKYSPLYIGLACGIVIVLLVMSTVMLWRYCLVSASKKLCCNGTYGEIVQQKSLPRKTESTIVQNGKEYISDKLVEKLRRSATLGSMSFDIEDSFDLDNRSVSAKNVYTNFRSPTTPLEPLTPSDLYASHLYLQKAGTTSLETPNNFSKSTPSLEELYAKVNFSKKKKNRMRKNDAAVIAMSKSHSEEHNNSLELFSSAVVVYNERTAL